MEAKFNIDREDFYVYKCPKERTRQRLTELANIGMEEVGIAEFGVRGIMSGLYIERVWNYSDKDWNEYLEWAARLIIEKSHPQIMPIQISEEHKKQLDSLFKTLKEAEDYFSNKAGISEDQQGKPKSR